MKALRTGALLLNIAALLFFGWSRFKADLAPLDMAVRFTELDRAEVIDNERLAAAFPELSENSRYLVPQWLGEEVVGRARSTATWGLVLAGLNYVGLMLGAFLASRVASKDTIESVGGS